MATVLTGVLTILTRLLLMLSKISSLYFVHTPPIGTVNFLILTPLIRLKMFF
jgi:hypothetical protein